MCARTWRQTAAAADPRIVLVKDDATIAGMYRYQLEQEGHTVWIAADGEAGLQVTRAVISDIVFLDVKLPKLDGFKVLAALREDPNRRVARDHVVELRVG